MKFLIQTYDNEVTHDFSFTLVESCKYLNWIRGSEDFECKYTDETFEKPFEEQHLHTSYIPVGSVEFVQNYLKLYYDLTVTPINIPVELYKDKYLKRRVIYGTKEDIEGIKFVKSTTKIKEYTEIVDKRFNDIPDDTYLISDVIQIESEWRAFVYNNMMVGLQNYTGDFCKFPNVNLIKEMIKEYKHCPPAYTLDVAVNGDDTFIIEVHDFFSCGLYGFADHRYLPFMFGKWFRWFLEKNNKVFIN